MLLLIATQSLLKFQTYLSSIVEQVVKSDSLLATTDK